MAGWLRLLILVNAIAVACATPSQRSVGAYPAEIENAARQVADDLGLQVSGVSRQ